MGGRGSGKGQTKEVGGLVMGMPLPVQILIKVSFMLTVLGFVLSSSSREIMATVGLLCVFLKWEHKYSNIKRSPVWGPPEALGVL